MSNTITITTQWIDIWKEEPPPFDDILFLTDDENVHFGCRKSNEKLRKCDFHCYIDDYEYPCDNCLVKQAKVTHWFPIPEMPKK